MCVRSFAVSASVLILVGASPVLANFTYPDIFRACRAATSASLTANEDFASDLGQVNLDVSGPTSAQGGSRATQNSLFQYTQIGVGLNTRFEGTGLLSASASALSPFSAVASSTILMTFEVFNPVDFSLAFNPGFPSGFAPATTRLRREDASPDGYETVYSRATTPGVFDDILQPGRYEFSLELHAVRSGNPSEPINNSVNASFSLSITNIPAPGAAGLLCLAGALSFARRRRDLA